jgi:LmbE family N-acetylglucosaminyl deacetylase
MLEDSAVARVLIVAAHPDDVDFGAAGTVAIWTDAGIEVTYCIVTDGDAGGFDRTAPRAEVAGVRRAEQEAAARVVGVHDLAFLGHPDGRVVASLDLRRDIARVIRRVRPDRVVTQSPERNYQRIYVSHPDHLATGEAALCAVYPDARNPFAFPELLDEGWEPHTVREVWMMAGREPTWFVDITTSVDRKIKALLCHVSQLPDATAMEERVREWTAVTARAGGLPDGAAAEAFQVLETG